MVYVVECLDVGWMGCVVDHLSVCPESHAIESEIWFYHDLVLHEMSVPVLRFFLVLGSWLELESSSWFCCLVVPSF